MSIFKKATKKGSFLRMAIIGPSGSGKSYTSLKLATHLSQAAEGKIACIDTERGSLKKYADKFDFDVLELDDFALKNYIEAIEQAEKAGYSILVIDSLSHAWMGKNGALEAVDKVSSRLKSNNSFLAWREVTPMHNKLVNTILECKMHVFVTMRSKTEYAIESSEKGKMIPKKIGMAPVQRDGVEYEFDILGDMTLENRLIVSKTRCSELAGEVYDKPGKELAEIIINWLDIKNIEVPAPPAEESKPSSTKKKPAKKTSNEEKPNKDTGFLSKAEASKIWSLAQKHGYDKDSFEKLLNDNFGIKSLSEIPEFIKDHIVNIMSEEENAASQTD